jgi:anti-sigma-K factor RskA
LKPMLVPERIAEGLPLAPSVWEELTALRARLLAEHVQKWRAMAASSAVVVLARALNAVVDDRRARELKVRLRSVVPSDDVLLTWMESGEAEQIMASALEGVLDDHAALCVGTALSSLASLAQAR